MKKSDLIKLGFKETSYIEEDIHFTEFTLETESFVIQVSGIDDVEIKIRDFLLTVCRLAVVLMPPMCCYV